MQTLIIKDLAVTEDLSRKEMSAVRGGTGKQAYSLPYGIPSLELTKNDFSFNANQMLSQCQDTVVNNGNNAAYVCGITANVKPHQSGSNNINLGGLY
jgi:hypothetical protein